MYGTEAKHTHFTSMDIQTAFDGSRPKHIVNMLKNRTFKGRPQQPYS